MYWNEVLESGGTRCGPGAASRSIHDVSRSVVSHGPSTTVGRIIVVDEKRSWATASHNAFSGPYSAGVYSAGTGPCTCARGASSVTPTAEMSA